MSSKSTCVFSIIPLFLDDDRLNVLFFSLFISESSSLILILFSKNSFSLLNLSLERLSLLFAFLNLINKMSGKINFNMKMKYK